MDIQAILYLLLLLFLVSKTGFFGLFKDENISTQQFGFFFFFKCLAIPVFWLLYKKMYGGIKNFDAGIFYSDARALNNLTFINPLEYFKAMVGLQDDSPGSYFYNHCIIYTRNWDNGRVEELFYNDNRLVIRVHALLDFISLRSYGVHALFNCFLSFTGLYFLYRSFKSFFRGKEHLLFLSICFFPSLWLYTGALLKEGLVIFVLGCMTWQLKMLIEKHTIRLKNFIWLCFLIFISVLLKPYFLCLALCCFSLFFIIQNAETIKSKTVTYFFISLTALLMVNFISLFVSHKSLIDHASSQQQIFANSAQGGIFLLDSNRIIRLNYDTTLISQKSGTNLFTIKKNAPYMYWEHSHQQDTLFCVANNDTTSLYALDYKTPPGRSNIEQEGYSKNKILILIAGFYYSLCYPLFFNASSALQLIASFENLVLFLSLLIVIRGFIQNRKDNLFPLVCVSIGILLCLIVGITTPNSGAILRYRSPAVIFIIMAALYYINTPSFLLKRKN